MIPQLFSTILAIYITHKPIRDAFIASGRFYCHCYINGTKNMNSFIKCYDLIRK